MILCAAQFNPLNKSPDEILNIHLELIEKAGVKKVDFIQYPEMSLSGYQRGDVL